MKLELVHASLDTYMSDEKTREDIRKLLELNALYYTLTETTEAKTITLIRDVVRAHGNHYQVVNPDSGDVAFLVDRSAKVLAKGGRVIIPTNTQPVDQGGHGPRCNSWVRFQYEGEVISHTGVHFVTYRAGSGIRPGQQVHQAESMARQMVKFGAGDHLATGSGDLNARLPNREDVQRVFDANQLTTTAQETGNLSNTEGNARIDYVWTYDRDERVSVDYMKVLDSGYHSDHHPIQVVLDVSGS